MRRLMVLCVVTALVVAASPVLAQSFTEEFDDITTLSGAGWVVDNNSTGVGSTSWGPIALGESAARGSSADFQGNDTVFPAFSGATTSYIGDNYNATTGTSDISDWLMTPAVMIHDGQMISFYTRTVDASAYPDRLELRMSLNGTSSNCGTLPAEVGDFTTVLVAVNPTLTTGGYPEVWTQFSATITGVPVATQGRFAFRYYVTNGGPSGTNSNYIGLDLVDFNSVPVELQSFTIQ